MSIASLSQLLDSPPLCTQRASELWHAVHRGGHDNIQGFQIVGNGMTLPRIGGLPALPLGWLRHPRSALPFETPDYRVFRSSGTTSSHRSASYFSRDGLTLYKLAALKTFAAVLQEAAPQVRRIVSMIPGPVVWPDSSLAQMVGWIADHWQVEFSQPKDLAQHVRADEPVLIMGTGFHFVEFCDAAPPMALPPGSALFETGGTKGRTRAVEPEAYLALLARHFQLPDSKIISEYGMCELAAQAYAWGRCDGTRQFHFPGWVRTFAHHEPHYFSQSGRGALAVYDPLRIDINAVLITEDMVTLHDSGFELEGRLQHVPLKGCSLNAEPVANENVALKPILGPEPEPESDAGGPDATNPERALTHVRSLLQEPQWARLLGQETGSAADGAWLWAQVQKAWDEADPCSFEYEYCRPNWLVISPQTHSLAALYPVLAGYIKGCRLRVRLGAGNILLPELCRRLPNISTAAPGTYITERYSEAYDGIICFGEDATIAAIKGRTNIPVQGFGSGSAVAVVEEAEVDSHANQIIRDAFSMGQRGCRNIRALVVIGAPTQFSEIASLLSERFKNYWRSQLDLHASVYLNLIMNQLHLTSRQCFRVDSQSPLFCRVDELNERSLLPAAFSLPMVFASDWTHAAQMVKQLNNVCLVTTNHVRQFTGASWASCNLGHSQKPCADGWWQGQKLFALEDLR